MPTGYTADIGDKNINFKQFVMRCMSAFVYDIRETWISERPGELKVGSYHTDELKKALGHLKQLEKLDEKTADACMKKEYKEKLKSHKGHSDKKRELKSRYLDMLKEINAWEPPTTEHTQFKEFMIEQITKSIDCDCYTLDKPEKISGKQWLAKEIKDVNWNINYQSEEYKKECERVAERNKWVNELCDSLEKLE